MAGWQALGRSTPERVQVERGARHKRPFGRSEKETYYHIESGIQARARGEQWRVKA